MQHIKKVIISLTVAIALALPMTLAIGAQTHAATVNPGDQINKGISDAGGDGSKDKLSVNIKTVVNVMLFALGAISVIMIVIGGIRYTTSGGESSSVKGAKDTIMYAIIGLVVAMLAYAIVNWVVGAFNPAPSTTPPKSSSP